MWSVPNRRRLASHWWRIQRAESPRSRRVVAHGIADLGGDQHPVAAAGEGGAEVLLRDAEVVDVGGVEQGDAAVEGEIDHPDAGRQLRVAPRPEHHGAEAEARRRQAARPQRPLLEGHARPACRWNTKLSQ